MSTSHQNVINALEEKLSRLGRRKDPAANYARTWLREQKSTLQERLKACRTAEPARDAASQQLSAAIAELETKRSELEKERAELAAEHAKTLAPYIDREVKARQEYEPAARLAKLEPVAIPYALGPDPGDTERIAGLAIKDHSNIHHNSISGVELAWNQRSIDEREMVVAIVNETEHTHEAALAAFERRWNAWSSFRKIMAPETSQSSLTTRAARAVQRALATGRT